MFQTPSLLLSLLLLVIFVLMRLAEDNLPEEQACGPPPATCRLPHSHKEKNR